MPSHCCHNEVQAWPSHCFLIDPKMDTCDSSYTAEFVDPCLQVSGQVNLLTQDHDVLAQLLVRGDSRICSWKCHPLNRTLPGINEHMQVITAKAKAHCKHPHHQVCLQGTAWQELVRLAVQHPWQQTQQDWTSPKDLKLIPTGPANVSKICTQTTKQCNKGPCLSDEGGRSRQFRHLCFCLSRTESTSMSMYSPWFTGCL